MTASDIVTHRLFNQQIAVTKIKKPQELVSRMIAMQAQDFTMAKWALGLRLHGIHSEDVEKAFEKGDILRTHVLRPTWHFVTPADIRWLVQLTAPRVKAFMSHMDKKVGLNEKIFARSNDVIARALEGGKFLTRNALGAALSRAKIRAEGTKLAHLVMRAELETIICSGPREGKQFTYALLDERAPKAKRFDREEALNELARRYFTTRGPATLQDFAWWSGLTIKEARAGAEALSSQFAREKLDGKEYIFLPANVRMTGSMHSTFLLPDYDEYGISYKDRSAIFPEKKAIIEKRGGNILFNHMLVVDGVICGIWQPVFKKQSVKVETKLFAPLPKTKQQAIAKAVGRYIEFFSA